MLKLTSLVVGLLTVISLAPSAQAFPLQSNTPDLHRRDEAVRPQVILQVNPQLPLAQEYRYRGESDRRHAELSRERELRARAAAERYHQLELAREREIQARLAAERRYHQQSAQHHGDYRGYGNDRDRRDVRSGNYYGH
jgi:hypothetical protein